MSGPITFRVSDSSQCQLPLLQKGWDDTLMVEFDFKSWLGPDQQLVAASETFLGLATTNNPGGWAIDFPPWGCCGSSAEPPDPADDSNPIQLVDLIVLPGGTKVGLSIAAGTPGFTYFASFVATAGPHARRKEVGLTMSCFALRPYPPTPLPTPPPDITNVGGSVTLPDHTKGTINVTNVTNGPITIVLPANSNLDDHLAIKDVGGNSGTYPITISGGGKTIDGNPTYTLLSDYMSLEIYMMGSAWGTI